MLLSATWPPTWLATNAISTFRPLASLLTTSRSVLDGLGSFVSSEVTRPPAAHAAKRSKNCPFTASSASADMKPRPTYAIIKFFAVANDTLPPLGASKFKGSWENQIWSILISQVLRLPTWKFQTCEYFKKNTLISVSKFFHSNLPCPKPPFYMLNLSVTAINYQKTTHFSCSFKPEFELH